MSGSQAGPWLIAPGVNKAVLAAQLPSPRMLSIGQRVCFWGRRGRPAGLCASAVLSVGHFLRGHEARGAQGSNSQRTVAETMEAPAVSDEKRK